MIIADRTWTTSLVFFFCDGTLRFLRSAPNVNVVRISKKRAGVTMTLLKGSQI